MTLSHSPNIVRDGLVLYLDAANSKSYPGSGTTWTDLSGNDNDGTLVNGVGYSSDNGGSMVFDGVNDSINCGNNTILNFGISDFAFGIFVKFISPAITNEAFIQKRTNVTLGYEIMLNENNKINASAAFNFGGQSNKTIGFTKWYYISIIRKNGISSLYIDGIFDRSAPNTINAGSDNNFYLAKDNLNSRWINCQIANVHGYSRALTESEIKQNFNALRGRYGI